MVFADSHSIYWVFHLDMHFRWRAETRPELDRDDLLLLCFVHIRLAFSGPGSSCHFLVEQVATRLSSAASHWWAVALETLTS